MKETACDAPSFLKSLLASSPDRDRARPLASPGAGGGRPAIGHCFV